MDIGTEQEIATGKRSQNTILAAIEVARLELARTMEQLKALHALQTRADQLLAFISDGEQLLTGYGIDLTTLGDAADPDAATPPEESLITQEGQLSIAAYAEMALETLGRPASIKALHACIQDLGLTITAASLGESLRHRRVFEKVGRGVYAMRAWPQERKGQREGLEE